MNDQYKWMDAIVSLVEGKVAFNSKGTEITEWDLQDTGITQPTKAKINAEIIRLQAEYDALEWSRNRVNEYPTVAELTVALYDTDDKAVLETKRAAVKTKWPKNNTGPVE